MSGPTLVIELAEPLSLAALGEFRALMVGLSSHFAEKRPGFFDIYVPAERLGVEDRREKDWRKPFPLPLLGNTIADEELAALVGFNPQREDWRRPFLVYLMGRGSATRAPSRLSTRTNPRWRPSSASDRPMPSMSAPAAIARSTTWPRLC